MRSQYDDESVLKIKLQTTYDASLSSAASSRHRQQQPQREPQISSIGEDEEFLSSYVIDDLQVEDVCLLTPNAAPSSSSSLSVVSSSSSSKLVVDGEMQLIYSDVYDCIAMYLRLWDSHTGRLFNHEEVNTMLRVMKQQSLSSVDSNNGRGGTDDIESFDDGREHRDHRIYHHGELLPDTHPHSGFPYLAFHLCEMSEHFRQIVTISSFNQDSDDSSSGGDGITEGKPTQCDGRLLILQFLQFIGSYLAMEITSGDYRDLLSIFRNS